MEVVITPTESDCGQVVVDIIAKSVQAGSVKLGLATGSSPLRVYRELIRRHREEGLSFADVDVFLLDEYVGLPRDHPQSYAHVIRSEFTAHVDLAPERVHSPDGAAQNVFAAADRYDALLRAAGPIDVQLLGIGSNGHIGFNEPYSSLRSRTRVATLTEQTRHDNARFFTTGDDVPYHVITQGLETIGEAQHLVLIATGSHKAAPIAAAVEGPLSARCPASMLQLHPHATIVIDDAAATQLQHADYHRYLFEHQLHMP